MHTIWKYKLGISYETTISMPRGAKLLHVAWRDGAIELWALVDQSQPLADRKFKILGTSNNTTLTEHEYVGTAIATDVWHVFDLGER